MSDSTNDLEGIAIIGLAGRFPGAKNTGEFWQNLCEGVESISFFTDQELDPSVDPALAGKSNYVRAKGVVDDVELFDAPFFGFTPREADIIDPQHRFFLECCWEALENAGYDPETYDGWIGVYAGASMNTYLYNNLLANPELLTTVGSFQTTIGNGSDFLPTRISYKLNLKGPSLNIQTACSTSLVAAHVACQSLLDYQCDMALAGGVSITLPHKAGYLYQEGMILSPDGHCRAFDAAAQGTVFGEGVGVVVLKRLKDALAHGDYIRAVIKGTSINNDGSLKVGYTAPSVDGQAEVIALAQAIAKVEADTISYVEAHGTGTALGDPVEIAALTEAFRASTSRKSFCAIGSVKTNIGHLDAAAGIAGLIKTVLALEHKMLPPSLHFKEPNPRIDFANSPFYVNSKLAEWKAGRTPRRAGVSSFGIGGTNAHAIIEEGPAIESAASSGAWQLLLLSAKTGTALEAASRNLAEHLKQNPDINLADVAFTLQVGRRPFSYRRAVVCHDVQEAVSALESLDSKRVHSAVQERSDRPVVFMFPGFGAQHVNMARELYETEPTFREQMDRCVELLKPHLGIDLREILFLPDNRTDPSGQGGISQERELQQTSVALPALFVVEYALAKLWIEWGVRPQAMIGYSTGEYVAACLAGVFSLEEALMLVAVRGRLMQGLARGAMLLVGLSEDQVRPFLNEELSLAAVNAPSLCILSGPVETVDTLQDQLTKGRILCQRLMTPHAFHSQMMSPILGTFAELVRKFELKPPASPFLSNVTGTWITAEEATDPNYWVKHLRQTVRFGDGVAELLKDHDRVFLEVGPGQTLNTMVRQQIGKPVGRAVLASLRHPTDPISDTAFFLNTLGRLWLAGVSVDWSRVHSAERPHRVPLPTYPFERQRYWVEPPGPFQGVKSQQTPEMRKKDIADWFYVPSWKRSVVPSPWRSNGSVKPRSRWLLFVDECGLGNEIARCLKRNGDEVISVINGDHFGKTVEGIYIVNSREGADYAALLHELRSANKIPDHIVHLWNVTRNASTTEGVASFSKIQDLGLYSVLFLVQALGAQLVTDPVSIDIISTGMQQVTGEERLEPGKATVSGLRNVIPQEYPNMRCRSIDVILPELPTGQEKLAEQLSAELASHGSDPVVAYRGNQRWIQTFDTLRLPEPPEGAARLKYRGVYLVTGGLGKVGFALAEYLARFVRARLVLVGRTAVPPLDQWAAWLEAHGEQDATSQKIRRVQALEKMGSEVLVFAADVASEPEMQAVISQIEKRFGQLDGVIHTAGIGTSTTIQETSRAECETHFQSKVHGLTVLAKLLQGRSLDFCFVTSSLSCVLGGIGLGAYSAANMFMDAFVNQVNQTSPTPWVSADYDGWRFEENETRDYVGKSVSTELDMSRSEGVETFRRILSLDRVSPVVVSTRDLQTRISQWIALESRPIAEPQKEIGETFSHPRPNLAGEYVAPRNDLEKRIVLIWQELLGIDQIGVFDNFFDLGGHSLLATQVVSRLRDAFHVDLPLRGLFEADTIAELAQRLEPILWTVQGLGTHPSVGAGDREEIEL